MNERIAYLEEFCMQILKRQAVLEVLVAELTAREGIIEADVAEKMRFVQRRFAPEDHAGLRSMLHETLQVAAVANRRKGTTGPE